MSQTTDEQPPPPSGPPPGPRRPRTASLEQLRRSRGDRKIAGVAGGLARHLDIDPTIVRVLFVVACFFGGSGFLLYVAAWLLLPEDGAARAPLSLSPSTRTALLIGAATIATLILLGNSFGGLGVPWPLVVIGLGAVVYLVVRDRERPAATWQPSPAAPPGPTGAPQSTGATAVVPDPADAGGWLVPGSASGAAGGSGPAYPPARPPAPAARPRRRRGGPLLLGPTVALLAVGLGVLGLYDTTGGHVVATAYPALAVAIVGVALVVAAFVARGGGLVLLGVLSVVALSVTAVVSTVSGLGEEGTQVRSTPGAAALVDDTYFVPTGRIRLDLSAVSDPGQLDGRLVDVGARAGTLVVVLPRGISTTVDAEVDGPGRLDLPDHSSGGIDSTYSGAYGTGPGTFHLRVHLLAGHIDVRTSR